MHIRHFGTPRTENRCHGGVAAALRLTAGGDMTRQPSTRLQVSAQRFLTRRMAHALVRRDVAMSDDPMRAQSRSLASGCVLAAIAATGCAIMALVTPHGTPGDAPIVMSRESGAIYVRIGDTLHPAFNLASARLIARTSAKPVLVADAAMAGVKRGPAVGIPGAPVAIGAPLPRQPWTVCDGERTVVIVGRSLALDPSRTVLVTPRGESAATTYLLYDGWRAALDLRDRTVVRALRLDGAVPLQVSRALLDTVPEAPPVVVPRIDGVGAPGPEALGGLAIGTVVRVARADANEFYVVLVDGVQRIGDVAADVIRFGYRGPDEIPTVTPATVARVATVTTLPVDAFPRRASAPVGAKSGALVCVQWQRNDTDGRSGSMVLTGNPTALDAVQLTDLAQADGDGPKVDAVGMPGDRSAYVSSARTLGDDGSTGTRFLVTDSGVAYGIPNDDAAHYLSLTAAPEAAPWSILAHLPSGPELSPDAASILRDGLPAPA
jgi:type VII secretion protein EccB